MSFHDVIIVGAGQAGLSVAYFLRRTNLSVLLLDAEEAGGGAMAAWMGFAEAFFSRLVEFHRGMADACFR